MSFGAAILLVQMEENKQHFGVLWFITARKVKMQLKCKKKNIPAVHGEGAMIDRTSQKWFVKFLCSTDILATYFLALEL